MLRLPLETVVLYVLSLLDGSDVTASEASDRLLYYMALFMNPPLEESVKKAVRKLLEMNAVVLGADRQLHMTAVGQRLLELPLDIPIHTRPVGFACQEAAAAQGPLARFLEFFQKQTAN